MAQKYVPAALRRLVRTRAGERCEYCLIPETMTLASHWVDLHPDQFEEREVLLRLEVVATGPGRRFGNGVTRTAYCVWPIWWEPRETDTLPSMNVPRFGCA